MTESSFLNAIATTLLEIAAGRGLISPQWPESWWVDEDRAAAAHRLICGNGGPSLRYDVQGGGVVWMSRHPVTGALTLFGACSDAEAGALETLTGAEQYRAWRARPEVWATWWEARNTLRSAERKAARPPLAVGTWVGGSWGGGAALGMVIETDKVGRPVQLQAGEHVFRPEPESVWFAWTGSSRIAAAESLANDDEPPFYSSYLAMRQTVVHRARHLIRRGEIPQDDSKPIKMRATRKKSAE